MREIVPFALGCLLGAALARVPARARAVFLPVACVLAGFAGTAVNGELASEFWAAFLSLDAALAWLGVTLSCATILSLNRRRGALDRRNTRRG